MPQVTMFLLHVRSYGKPKCHTYCMMVYHYPLRISEPLALLIGLMTHLWAIFSIWAVYTCNVLHCYRGLLKSGQSLAPVVKPNNLIPPNVPPTSLSSYMSHNIITAIFSYSSQSLTDVSCIANKENMCLPYKPLISLECAKNKSGVSARSVLCTTQPAKQIYGQ